jgi:hypothetical protein
MKKLVVSTLATASIAVTAGLGLASAPADLTWDPYRMFFRIVAPSTGTVDFQMLPDNVNNPIVLPCDLEVFGGQFDFKYVGSGPTVYPKVTTTFFDHNNQIISHGCLNDTTLPNILGPLAAMTAGTTQIDGLTMVSSTNTFCQWLFQPHDLPADKVVRIHMAVAAYPNDSYQGATVDDPTPANNDHDFYVRRACTCE